MTPDEPLPETTAAKIARLLDEYIARHGPPPFYITVVIVEGEDVEITEFELDKLEETN